MKDRIEMTLPQFLVVCVILFIALLSFGELVFIDRSEHFHPRPTSIVLEEIEVSHDDT